MLTLADFLPRVQAPYSGALSRPSLSAPPHWARRSQCATQKGALASTLYPTRSANRGVSSRCRLKAWGLLIPYRGLLNVERRLYRRVVFAPVDIPPYNLQRPFANA
jgi:hypothetical protein